MLKRNAGGDESGRGQSPARGAGKAPRLRLDLSLKQMFMIRAIVADFMLTCQPERARLLVLATLQRWSTEHVGPKLRHGLADTVWRAKVRGEDGRFGYVIVEFQTRVDRTIARAGDALQAGRPQGGAGRGV